MKTLLLALAALLIAAACADTLPDAPRQPADAELSEIERAAAKLDEWLANLRAVRLEISAVTNVNAEREGDTAQVSATAMITDEQYYFSTYVISDETPDAPGLRFETLVAGGWSHARWYDIAGWLRSQLTDSLRRTTGVIAPRQIASSRWTELPNVSVATVDHEGGRAWLVEYEADRVELALFPELVPLFTTGIVGVPSGATSTEPISAVARLWIDHADGALRRIELTQRLNLYGSGQDFAIASTIELDSWNSPLDIPAPEPLLEDAEWTALVALSSAPSAPHTNTGRILQRTREEWFSGGREAVVKRRAALLLNGEERRITSEATIRAGDDALPISLFDLPQSLSSSSWRSSSGSSNSPGGFARATLGTSLHRDAIAAHQDLLTAILQKQLDALLDSPPTVERVLYLDFNACFEPNTGELFGGDLDAAALTSAGLLELTSTIRIGPPAGYLNCYRE